MALIKLVIRKMIKNKWLVGFLLVGLIISLALISSISIYTDGILQKLLIDKLESYQQEHNEYPGSYLISLKFSNDRMKELWADAEKEGQPAFSNSRVKKLYQERLTEFHQIANYLDSKVKEEVGLPLLSKELKYSTRVRLVKREEAPATKGGGLGYANIGSVSNLQKHIKLIEGRLPKNKTQSKVYETLITPRLQKRLNLRLDQTVVLRHPEQEEFKPIKIKPVGLFTVQSPEDPYWMHFSPTNLGRTFLLSERVMKEEFIDRNPTLIRNIKAHYSFNYHQLKGGLLNYLQGSKARIAENLNEIYDNFFIEAPMLKLISSYAAEKRQLTIVILSLNIPVIIMLCLYLFMVSKLVIRQDENEIAVLTSRGAKRWQIVFIYLVEGLLLVGLALAVGPWLGKLISRLLGAPTGFLQFKNRTAVSAVMNLAAYKYAALAAVVAFITMVLPAYSASKNSIIDYKQQGAREVSPSIWERFYLDGVLIAVSLYGYYLFQQRQEIIKITNETAVNIAVNPLLFFIPALFILGSGLLLLRLYPLFVNGIYWLGRKIWSLPLYAALVRVGRSTRSYHFLMIFLIMTLATGIFSSSAARTINQNKEEKIKYNIGSDIVLQTKWQNDVVVGPGGAPLNKQPGDIIHYKEPAFKPFQDLSGVKQAARVFKKSDAKVYARGSSLGKTTLLGINSYNFGKTAWYRQGLLDYHLYSYLNLLSSADDACLISRSLSQEHNLKPGDKLEANWVQSYDGVRKKGEFVVYGIVDYWPTWNPQSKQDNSKLIVGNLGYIQSNIGVEPYQVWLKLKEGASSGQVYSQLEELGLMIKELTNRREKLAEVRNQPYQIAVNGMMTLGFIISGVTCFLGFLIYWGLALKSRVLQFGIFRAMGLSTVKLIIMMIWEQLLTSGTAILLGVFVGLTTSKLFVPLFQISKSASSQVPPFHVISQGADRVKIYYLLAVNLLIGFLMLGYLLSKLKINQAIKLGEE